MSRLSAFNLRQRSAGKIKSEDIHFDVCIVRFFDERVRSRASLLVLGDMSGGPTFLATLVKRNERRG